MTQYIVTYDISQQSELEGRADDVRQSLEHNNAQHIQLSVWILASTSTARQIYDAIARHLVMSRDRLFVAEYTDNNWMGGAKLN